MKSSGQKFDFLFLGTLISRQDVKEKEIAKDSIQKFLQKMITNGLLLNFVKKRKKRLYFVRNPDPTAALWGPILPVS